MIQRVLGALTVGLMAVGCFGDDARGTVLVVIGAVGSPEFGESFTEQAAAWERVAKRGGHRFALIGRDNSPEPSDRERLRLALELVDRESFFDTQRAMWRLFRLK